MQGFNCLRYPIVAPYRYLVYLPSKCFDGPLDLCLHLFVRLPLLVGLVIHMCCELTECCGRSAKTFINVLGQVVELVGGVIEAALHFLIVAFQQNGDVLLKIFLDRNP